MSDTSNQPSQIDPGEELETVDTPTKVSQLQEKVAELENKVTQAKEAQLRSQADYQNLQRRSQDERSRWIKLAARELITDLLQPLDHLGMAAMQLQDPGLDMTIKQFWQTLEQHGLKEIEVTGTLFDPHLMEVVERQGEGEQVIKVVRRGYTLNEEVIQHAKVIVGVLKSDTKTKNSTHSKTNLESQM